MLPKAVIRKVFDRLLSCLFLILVFFFLGAIFMCLSLMVCLFPFYVVYRVLRYGRKWRFSADAVSSWSHTLHFGFESEKLDESIK